MQNRKNAIIVVLAVLVVALGVLLYVTNADKGKLSDANNGLTAQVESLEEQVSTLKDEAAQAAETAKAELDEAVKAKAEAEAALQAVREEASGEALSEGVVPVTWEVTAEHLMIDTDEARVLYEQIVAGDYPTMEELLANPVVQQLDALSAYYKSVYGNTADIDTPEREALREELKDWFLTLGSARTESVDENGKHHYVYDGPLNRDFQMELVLGLPASGKSTRVADPDSEAMGAFILDPDVIKAELPEYKESHGAAADAIHFEGMGIFERAISEFLTGDMQGVNIVLPIVGGDFDEMMQQYVLPFEAAGYNVKVKFCPAKENEAAARVVMRELGGGQLINSAVAFNFGDGPENVYNEIKDMINAKGEPYGYTEDEETQYQLEQVVILSRHNLRAPLSSSGSVPDELTPHEWIKWSAGSSELTLLGGIEEASMGQYFRKWLDREGLIPENTVPEEGEVRFNARAKQRCIATARYFAAGMLPTADIEVEHPGDANDTEDFMQPVLHFYSDDYAADATAQVAAMGGDTGFDGLAEQNRDVFKLIMDTVDMQDSEIYQSGKYGDLLADGFGYVMEADSEPDFTGSIKPIYQVADALILQYYEEPDAVKAAFGHELTDEDWARLGAFMTTCLEMKHGAPLVAANITNPLLRELESEFKDEDRKFSFFCAHDCTVLGVLSALGAEDFALPESIETKTPIGIKLVFERRRDDEGQAWYRVSLIYRSTEQIRSGEMLTLDNPPLRYDLRFEGVETNADGLIAEADLLALFDRSIAVLDGLEDAYAQANAA